MLKLRHVVLIAFLISIFLFINACSGRKGELSLNSRPTIAITSYEGVHEQTSIDSTSPIGFQQRIYWEASDNDGVVEKYAFRVIDENDNPLIDEGITVGTPGYNVVNEDGWVYHYIDGADESIPLSETDARSIWTDQVNALINFPTHTANGDSIPVTSIFEVKCKDNDGDECETSAKKYYFAASHKPECNIRSSTGDMDGEEIGTGIVLLFDILDYDQFVGNQADHFEFRFEKRDLLNNIIPESGGGFNDSLWWSTENYDNIHECFVTLDDENGTKPALKLNTLENGVPQDSTFIIAKAIDLAGIESKPDTVSVVVKEGFYPSSLIYNGIVQAGNSNFNDIFVLGDNHYTTYNSLGQILPSVLTSSGFHYATPLWVDQHGDYSAIHSDDIKVYMHWGYNGEFKQNGPNQKLNNIVYDEETSKNYFSEIKYYDLRLDGEPYHYAPLPASEYNVIDDDTGKEWLRVPVNHAIAQETVLSDLEIGSHKFEVRAVDLQNVGDESPTSFTFYLKEPVPVSEKEGILVIDDSPGNPVFSPEAYVDSLYTEDYFFQDYVGTVDVFDSATFQDEIWVSPLHFGQDVFSATDLQNYKIVLYFSDSPAADSYLAREYDVLNLYLEGGGNLIISSGANLDFKIQTDLTNWGYPLFTKYFGINSVEDDAIMVPSQDGLEATFMQLAYFVGATAENGSTDIDLMLPSFNQFVNYNPLSQAETNALGPVAYFNEDYLSEGAEVMYRFNCKEAGDGPLDPSSAEYDYYNGQPVAVKKATGDSKCYLFSFPLSYMEPDHVKTMLNDIISEIEE